MRAYLALFRSNMRLTLRDRSVLIPTRWVESVSWADRRVNVQHSRSGL